MTPTLFYTPACNPGHPYSRLQPATLCAQVRRGRLSLQREHVTALSLLAAWDGNPNPDPNTLTLAQTLTLTLTLTPEP